MNRTRLTKVSYCIAAVGFVFCIGIILFSNPRLRLILGGIAFALFVAAFVVEKIVLWGPRFDPRKAKPVTGTIGEFTVVEGPLVATDDADLKRQVALPEFPAGSYRVQVNALAHHGLVFNERVTISKGSVAPDGAIAGAGSFIVETGIILLVDAAFARTPEGRRAVKKTKTALVSKDHKEIGDLCRLVRSPDGAARGVGFIATDGDGDYKVEYQRDASGNAAVTVTVIWPEEDEGEERGEETATSRT